MIDFEVEARLGDGKISDRAGEQEGSVACGPEAGEIVEELLRVMVAGLATGVDVN